MLLKPVLLWDVLSAYTFTILNLLKDSWNAEYHYEASPSLLYVCMQLTNRVFVLLVLLRQ